MNGFTYFWDLFPFPHKNEKNAISYGTPVGTIEPRKINPSSLLLWGIGRHHWEEMSQLWKWKQKKVSKIQCYTVSSHPHYKVICSCSFSFFYENFHFAFFALWRGLQNSPVQISQTKIVHNMLLTFTFATFKANYGLFMCDCFHTGPYPRWEKNQNSCSCS